MLRTIRGVNENSNLGWNLGSDKPQTLASMRVEALNCVALRAELG